jgi:hypothetical protein
MTASNAALLWILIALAAIALLVGAAIASRRQLLSRSAALREQFGPEYDRAVEQLGSSTRAERELAARARRVHRIPLHPVAAADRARFESSWARIQAQFVDDPVGAVTGANELIKEVMRARGYPIDDFDQRVADLSVDHATVVQHYRAARSLAESVQGGQPRTEDLRQAVIHYRALFDDLLRDAEPTSGALREVHA